MKKILILLIAIFLTSTSATASMKINVDKFKCENSLFQSDGFDYCIVSGSINIKSPEIKSKTARISCDGTISYETAGGFMLSKQYFDFGDSVFISYGYGSTNFYEKVYFRSALLSKVISAQLTELSCKVTSIY